MSENKSPAKEMFCSEIKSPAKQVFGDQNKSSSNQIFGDENKEPSAWGAIETPMCDVRVTDSPVSSQLSPIVCQVVGAPLSEELNTCSAMEGSDPSKEKNSLAGQKDGGGLLEVYIKWESGNLIKGLKLLRNSCLSDLRKLIEAHFEEVGSKQQQQQQFIFLLLGHVPTVQFTELYSDRWTAQRIRMTDLNTLEVAHRDAARVGQYVGEDEDTFL
ncbi:P-loop containing nucleoside triphosphate hydrolase superfamily protein [Zea mays]|uniref:p-loop containing nucleoside triphosphate hydrolase superfamily protein n=1 Tax=Zea mays TaxID=4577 RepID=A0A1D6I820_MAIZE|nr:P-loop containing nucleoside triphosphate hydrolase superfamily protein [Zea mays]